MRKRGPKTDVRPFEVIDQHGTVAARCWYKETASTYAKETVAYTETGELRKFKVVRRKLPKGAVR